MTAHRLTDVERAYYALNARVYRWLSRIYDWITSPLALMRDEVVRFSGAAPNARVIDVATGTGAQAFAFSKRCAKVDAIDISDAMLEVARRKRSAPNITYRRADAIDLPFDDGSFDVACISFALHEMPPGIREAVLAETTRVLRSGGTLVVVDYARREGLVGDVLYRAFEIVEREPYVDFLASDVPALMNASGVRFDGQEHGVFGMARVLRARKA